jgi:predicted acyl esterase
VPLLIALVLALLLAAPASADPVPKGYTYEDAWLTSRDGTQLHAGVFLPADRKEGERHPVLQTITPYTAPNGGATAPGNTSGPVIRFPELFDEERFRAGRWAYVQVDARGFGGSGGCFEYYGPNERQDAGAAVEWAADQPWSAGKVGMWGKSYDAASEVLALAARPRGLAATVIQAPGLSAYTGLWMNRVHYAAGRYATTATYTGDDLTPPQNLDTLASAEYFTAWANGLTQAPTCRTDAIVSMNTVRDRDDPFWANREPYRDAVGSTVPTFWSHGFYDANTKPVHLDVWGGLAGTKQAWFGQYTHLRAHEAGVGRAGFLDEAFRFLDRHVRDVQITQADPPITVQEGNGEGRWRAEEQWPPSDVRTWSMPLREGTYADAPGNTSSSGDGAWSIGAPLPHVAHLAGEPTVTARLTTSAADVNLVAHLYDVDAAGVARLVNRGAVAAKESGEQEISFPLYPQDWVFERGHRIALRLSGGDDNWFSPGVSSTGVQVTAGSLTLPLLRYFRGSYLEGGPSDGMDDNRPWKLDPGLISEAAAGGEAPPARELRPTPPVTGPAPARKSAGKLRARLTKGRRLVVTGRMPAAKRVRITVRFGGVQLAQRRVKVRQGRFRAVFGSSRLRSGRLEVTARGGRAAPLRVRLRVKPRR